MKLLFTLIAVYLFLPDFCNTVRIRPEYAHDDDIYRNVSELITSKGYPVEDHIVQTEDGYLLSVQRIPYGTKEFRNPKNRPIALLQHGLLASASDFVMNFPEQSLGFILADKGYDVWLGNSRGNVYSRHHIKLKPSMSAFWNFSFDEMAKYDLPAMIDYILNKTEQKQLFYIGHSQGTTAAFALLSENASYNKKIKLFVALGPVATVGYITNVIKYLAPLAVDFDWLLKFIGVDEFLPSTYIVKYISDKVCESKEKFICEELLYQFFGWDEKTVNETRLPVYFAHYPAGASTNCIVHYAQLVESKKFSKFDYGSHNQEHYNQSTPPDYDVSKITTPTALFWAVKDSLADFIDVGLLERKLKSEVMSYCVPNEDFNHGDFVYGINATELVYKEVLSLMQKYLGP